MADTTQGFYVPGSLSSSYVQSKRNAQGSLDYDSQQNQIGIAKQAAIQDLQSQYESTIENAYASYLANQRNIAMSNMGQGYKAIYSDLAQQNMQQSIATDRASIQSAMTEVQQNAAIAKANVRANFETEVANLDRVANSFQQYRDYLSKLTRKDEKNKNKSIDLFTEEENALSTEDIYERLATEFSQRAKNYNNNDDDTQGMSYVEWMSNMYSGSDNANDKEWYKWFLSGGYQDFMRSVSKRNATDTYVAEEAVLKAKKHKEDVKQIMERLNAVEGLIGTVRIVKDYDSGKTWPHRDTTEEYAKGMSEYMGIHAGELYDILVDAKKLGLTEDDIPDLKYMEMLAREEKSIRYRANSRKADNGS